MEESLHWDDNRLKIDLEAVHSAAGMIESSDFFKSVKDHVRKEKEEENLV
jgi:hypothetical protein